MLETLFLKKDAKLSPAVCYIVVIISLEMIKAMSCCSNISFPKCKLFYSEFLFVPSCCKHLGMLRVIEQLIGTMEMKRLISLLEKLIKI